MGSDASEPEKLLEDGLLALSDSGLGALLLGIEHDAQPPRRSAPILLGRQPKALDDGDVHSVTVSIVVEDHLQLSNGGGRLLIVENILCIYPTKIPQTY